MSQIIRYVAPHTECINGIPRPEHHFWLDIDQHDDHMEVFNWLTRAMRPQTYQCWPETVGPFGTQTTVQYHVILQKDRDAMLFKLRW